MIRQNSSHNTKNNTVFEDKGPKKTPTSDIVDIRLHRPKTHDTKRCSPWSSEKKIHIN